MRPPRVAPPGWRTVRLARPAERRLARRVVAAVRAGGGGHPAVAALLDALRDAAGHTDTASA